MSDVIVDCLRWYAVIGSAVMTGLFFSFSVFIMLSLNKIQPGSAITVTQSINTNITQPLFLLAFLGTSIVCVVLGGWALFNLGDAQGVYALIGSVLFVVGNLIVTGGFNIPLNNELDKVDPEDEGAALAWKSFYDRWVPLNHLRTVLVTAATVFLILAIREAA